MLPHRREGPGHQLVGSSQCTPKVAIGIAILTPLLLRMPLPGCLPRDCHVPHIPCQACRGLNVGDLPSSPPTRGPEQQLRGAA